MLVGKKLRSCLMLASRDFKKSAPCSSSNLAIDGFSRTEEMSGKPAARITDPTLCPLPGHGVTPIVAGSADVLFDGLSATRQGDPAACGGVMVGNLATTVFINGRNAATVGSVGSHGNLVISGSGSVIIGDSHTPAPFLKPASLLQLKTYAISFLSPTVRAVSQLLLVSLLRWWMVCNMLGLPTLMVLLLLRHPQRTPK